MILEQHYLACLSQASYLVVDEASGGAAVVDPRRDVEVYLARARDLGATIRHVLLTHFHADFLAGHLELAERTGATIRLGRRARAEYAFEPLGDGDVLALGDVRIEALETPGHTPESVCYLVSDGASPAGTPAALLTGDTLFVGDVGRPDLMASKGVTAAELAGAMYESLRTKLLPLPDATLVYPGHGAGSACGKSLSSETVSTIGEQRRANWALQPMERGAFVARLVADQPSAPAYFPRAAELNRRQRETLGEVLAHALRPMALEEVLAAHATGSQLVDARGQDAFARAHLAGSLNIGLDGRFAEWAGTLLDLERSIVLVADPGREEEAATRLARVGIDRVEGFLEGGAEAFAALPEFVRSVARVTAREAAAGLAGADALLVLDVRTRGEFEAAHVPGARNLPLAELPARIAEVPRERAVLVHCKSGYRSMSALSLLARHGYGRVVDVAGGFDAWLAAGAPVEGPARAAPG